MRTFELTRATSVEEALDALTAGAQAIAGGTELLNWLKEGIEAPARLVDINRLPLDRIEFADDRVRLGALCRMSDVAAHPELTREFPVLVQSLLRAASPQLRNMATLGGNLMQRTRCPYFRADTGLPCNKRVPGSGCSARHGDTTSAAILGWSDDCVATHPSDLAVALAALDAVVVVRGPEGERRIPATSFHRLPGDEPARHNYLRPDELITAIEVPRGGKRFSHYLKVRERVSYEFAVVSAAAVVEWDGETITRARVALGGVAHGPYRMELVGVPMSRLAEAVRLTRARPLPGNEYKVTLAERAAVRAIKEAMS
ncbi:FAD binding domain-containing protein [Amycolatopsis thermoflava]|uniref:FAD binding domain-containing protein n=1 Tax=Amycolatopsis thermoflava TaxID=84480 RepID=UPI003F4A3746